MPEINENEMGWLLTAAFGSPAEAFDAWSSFVEQYPLDDVPGSVIPVLPLVAGSLARYTEEVDDSARLAGLRRRQWYGSGIVVAAFERAKSALAAGGIDPIDHGGLAYRRYWTEPSARPLDDARLVVHPSEASQALEVLGDAGFSAPSCPVPGWHDRLDLIDPDGVRVAISCWILGPQMTEPAAELGWRSNQVDDPGSLLVARMGREILGRRALAHGPLWRADVHFLLEAAGPDTFDAMRRASARLGLGAVVGEGLRIAASDAVVGRSGRWEYAAWRAGRRRLQRLTHHPRLARAVGGRVSPATYRRYRRHVASHGPAGSPRT